MQLHEFSRGRVHRFHVPVTPDAQLSLPVILVRGAQDGPVLLITAGVHGDEYEGVRAIFDVIDEIDPAVMSGDLVCIPVCNPPAHWHLSRCSPLDDGNLARVFPGKPDGTPTERIAWILDQQFLSIADFYLDLHSGGVRFVMPTMIGYDATDPRAEAAALAFGAPVIWAHDVIAPGRTVSAAKARNVPWLYTEARGAGRIHPEDLEVFRGGIWNLMRHLAIVPGRVPSTATRLRLCGDGNIDDSIASPASGFLVPEVELLERVAAGQLLGRLLDLHGATIAGLFAKRDGIIALVHACPMVQTGEPVFLITGADGTTVDSLRAVE